jgi:hypothetical protein
MARGWGGKTRKFLLDFAVFDGMLLETVAKLFLKQR